jgi:hypothetical protein
MPLHGETAPQSVLDHIGLSFYYSSDPKAKRRGLLNCLMISIKAGEKSMGGFGSGRRSYSSKNNQGKWKEKKNPLSHLLNDNQFSLDFLES